MSAIDVTIEARRRPGPSWEVRASASLIPDVLLVSLEELGIIAAADHVLPPPAPGAKFSSAI